MEPGDKTQIQTWLARLVWRPWAMVLVWAQLGVALALYLSDAETARAALLAKVGIGLLAVVDGLGLWGLIRRLWKRQGDYGLVWIGAVLGGLALNGSTFLRTHNSYMFWLGMTFWFAIGGLFGHGAAAVRPAPGRPYGTGRRIAQVVSCVGAVVGFGYFLLGGLTLGMRALGYEPARGSPTTSSPSSSPSSSGSSPGWTFWLAVSVMVLNAVVWGSALWQRRRRRRIYLALEAEGAPSSADGAPSSADGVPSSADGVPSAAEGASLEVQYANAKDHRSWWRRPLTAVGHLAREPEAWVFKGRAMRGGAPVLLRFGVPLTGMTLVKGGSFQYRAMRWLKLEQGEEAHYFTIEAGVTTHRSEELTRAAYDRLMADAAPPPDPGR